MLPLLLSLLLATPALAGNAEQLKHAAESGAETTTLTFAWRAPSSGRDRVQATLSSAEIEADKTVRRRVQLLDLHEAMARAARKSAKGRRAVELTARATAAGVQLGASGPAKATRATMDEASEAMEQERARWLIENQVFELEKGALSYDHALIAADRAAAVEPLAERLREGTSTDRQFVERALLFTQSIPYQKGKRGGDAGFQRPLALLARNKGDCDGKSALFLALVRAELPDVPLAMVYVPEHALVGVGLPAEGDDRTFKADNLTYVYAEPVGPAAYPLGQTAPENKRAGKKGQVRPLP